MKVVVVDCGSGNLASATRALTRAAADRGIAAEILLTNDPNAVAAADRVVLPGQGAFADCARGLDAVDGLRTAIDASADRGTPFLGICVGMQLMADTGEEHGIHKGLGWIGGRVRRMPDRADLKIPHMGWNDVVADTTHPLLRPGEAYFLHSYAFDVADPAERLAATDHGGPITAAVGRDNMIGVQFHPEKSQAYGLAFLARFLEWRP